MPGRGLAAAWGLLAVLIAGTVGWLALTDDSGDLQGSAPVVTVELPPFPEPASQETAAVQPEPLPAETAPEPAVPPEPATPAEAPEPAPRAAEEPAPAATAPGEGVTLAGPEPAAIEPESSATSASEGDTSRQPPAGEPSHTEPLPAIPEPEKAVVAEQAPLPSGPEQAEQPARHPPETEPQPQPEQAREPAPATDRAEAVPSEPPPAVEPAAPPPASTPAGHREAGATKPASEDHVAAEEGRSDSQGTGDGLPPTVEVGALRPVPGEVLQPLKPPDETPGDPALTEEGPFGPLPAVAKDGRVAWKAYSRAAPADRKAGRIAIVIGNLGLADTVTERAINDLPPDVTLSFAPYAANVASWVARARAAGHEVLLDLPMEPIDYPKNDPGPKALFTSLGQERNIERLQWVLSRAAGYVGVTNYMGSRFTTSPEALRPVLEALRDRGLMFLDSRSAARSLATTMASEVNLPRAVNDRFIDVTASRAAIERRLGELETIARREGAAVGIGYPYPVTLDRIQTWAAEIGKRKDLDLAPISAVVGMQADR